MNFFLSPYELKYSNNHSKIKKGFLFKLQDGEHLGYSVIHSWPELGGETYEEIIASLISLESSNDFSLSISSYINEFKDYSSIVYKSIYYAYLDLNWRKNKVNPLEQKTNHKNAHYEYINSYKLIFDIKELKSNNVLEKVNNSENLDFKLKLGNDLENEVQILKAFIEKNKNVKLRLDFNAKLNFMEVFQYLADLDSFSSNIMYIEDPCPWSFENWSQLKKNKELKLALDIESKPFLKDFDSACTDINAKSDLVDRFFKVFDYVVLKPASQNLDKWIRLCEKYQKKFILTSFMSHPLDQVITFYEVLRLKEHPLYLSSGFQTEDVYLKNKYAEVIFFDKGVLKKKPDVGWGFDSFLREENWVSVKEFNSEMNLEIKN